MATITPVPASIAGSALTYTAASAGGDTIATSGYTSVKLFVKNGGASNVDVTLTGVQKCSRGFLHDTVISVAAGAEEDISLPGDTIDLATGNVSVTYSATASVTVAAISG